ncbi:cation:proton antiporter [Slackia heliotrinireducens]|uniref:cation:proton antiporter n=1 Tax=Slackia heliotrinireducens TaxID=84110 RepID=UPI003315E269
MFTFVFILALAVAVLASAIIAQVVRGVSMPLIQIAIGAALALVGLTSMNFTINSELFLVLFIAPLLYLEAQNVDKVALWTNRVTVTSLAIGLVLVVVLMVGFSLHFLEPSIPLSAAFALGAALGPTDAVAVTSLGKSATLRNDQRILLSGECLINDASGVVSFQFATAALVTGTFSLIDATTTFFVSFFGGIILGLLLQVLFSYVNARVRDFGLEDTMFHVMYAVITPFAIFLIAEELGVSGILAVVAAGLIHSFLDRRMSPEDARQKIISSSVWQVLSFSLNGIVFVLLGMQLPNAMSDTLLESTQMTDVRLAATAVFLALLTVVVRMFWFVGIDLVGKRRRARNREDAERRLSKWRKNRPRPHRAKRPVGPSSTGTIELSGRIMKVSSRPSADLQQPAPETPEATWADKTHALQTLDAEPTGAATMPMAAASTPEELDDRRAKRAEWLNIFREALAMSLAGPKGAISLSIMFTMPYFAHDVYFQQRELLIFIASIIIVITLLLANFVLPLLLPKAEVEPTMSDDEASVDVLRAVVEDLTGIQTKGNRRAVQAVIHQYNDRIDRFKQQSDVLETGDDTELRLKVYTWQEEYVVAAMAYDGFPKVAGYTLLRRIGRARTLISHDRGIRKLVLAIRQNASFAVHAVKRIIQDREPFQNAFEDERLVRELQIEAMQASIEKLRELLSDDEVPSEHAARLIVELQRNVRRLRRIDRDTVSVADAYQVVDKITEIRKQGLRFELEHIQSMYEEERITRATAMRMRQNVHLMEIDLEDRV